MAATRQPWKPSEAPPRGNNPESSANAKGFPMSLKSLASRKFFKGIHIKILGLVVISAASLALVIVISAVLLRDMLIEDRKEKIRAAVEIATTSFDSLAQAVEKNEMTRDQALRQARDLIHTMRFDGKNYVFAFTRDGLSIGHGTNRAIEGANLPASANTALAGLTRRTIDAMTGNSQVFLFDHGPKGGTGADVPKIYFLKDQAALGFMVASVIEIDDINAAVTRQVTVLALAGGLVTLVTALIGGRIGWRIGRRIDRLAAKMKRLSDGDISVEFPEAQAGDQI